MAYWIDNKKFSDYILYYSQCDENIDESEKNTILKDLDKGLEEYDVFQYFNAQPTIFRDYDHLVIAKDKNNKSVGLIGVKSFIKEDIKFLYFWTAAININYHGTLLIYHLYKWLLEKVFFYDGFFNIIATKTYNPIVYNLFLKNKLLLGKNVGIYPQIGDKNDDNMVNLAKKIFNHICPQLSLDVETGRVVGGQGVLAPNFFPRLPYCSNESVYNHFKNTLTPNDQILSIIHIPQEAENLFNTLILKLNEK